MLENSIAQGKRLCPCILDDHFRKDPSYAADRPSGLR